MKRRSHFPFEHNFQISTSSRQKVKYHHQTYTLTPGYAFTLNKGQGQTLGSIMDIWRPPPPCNLNSFSFYVALSGSRGCKRIRLLGDFEDKLFISHSLEDLRQKDVRLADRTWKMKEVWDVGLYCTSWSYSTKLTHICITLRILGWRLFWH